MRVDLALIGFGNVGRRFARLLNELRPRVLTDCDLETRVVAIATRTHGAAFDVGGIDVGDALVRVEGGRRLASRLETAGQPIAACDVIRRMRQSDAALRVMIETTTLDVGAGRPAIDHVTTALDSGCHVVTANKGPAAFAYRALRDRARTAGLSFLFEGAVMDGVPIFNFVRETLPAVNILGFRGVVNSTTNHILTALEDGDEFGQALARMQADGIAEADASLDVDGWDAAAKAAALANVLMDAGITPHAVDRAGVGPESAERARAAKARNERLRLVAQAERDTSGSVSASVQLVELPARDLLASLRGTANALVFRTDVLGEIAVCQLEGTLTQTAYALLSDLITVRRRHPQAPDAAPVRRNP
ncbi:MAG: homoserine dehydrogenase [Acidobacteria bacterium]|nr:homoserine dehydrogenase [Acidobacteriota bacterium]MCA1650681.1 homoserine dehydrogenase [Acidobacteriota bacterium]